MLRALVLKSPPGEPRRASAVTLPWPVGAIIPKLFSKTAVKADEIPSKRRAKEIGFFNRYPLVRKIILVILILSYVGHAPNVSATRDQRPINENPGK